MKKKLHLQESLPLSPLGQTDPHALNSLDLGIFFEDPCSLLPKPCLSVALLAPRAVLYSLGPTLLFAFFFLYIFLTQAADLE